MNILLSIPTLANGKGGSERVASELAAAMLERGHNVALAFNTTQNEGKLHYPIPASSPLLRYEDSLASLKNLRQGIKELNPDIILDFYADWRMHEHYDILRGLGIPVAFQECSNPDRVMTTNWAHASNAFQMRLDVLRNACGIRFTQQQYANSLPMELRHLAHAFPNAFRRSDGVDGKRRLKTILHVGASKANKNVGVLLDAFSMLLPDFPDWKLLLCTTKPIARRIYYEKILERISEEFREDQVIIKEDVADMESMYKSASIHCITSLSEGLPNCVCEAMSQGTPSVGFAEGIGTNSLIRNGIDGLLADNSPETLAAALSRLMSDNDFAARLGANAWEAAQNFDPEAIYDKWEDFFEKSIERAKKGGATDINLPAPGFTSWEDIEAKTWADYLRQKIDGISGNVLFYGGGQVYSQFKNDFSHLKPLFMILDSGLSDKIDGLEVIKPENLDDSLKSLPIIVFSREARVIAHRLRTVYKVTGDIICVDRRAWLAKNFVNELQPVSLAAIKTRQDGVANGKYPYRTYTVPMVSQINIENPECAFCGSDNIVQYMTSKVIPWYGGDEFRLVRCQDCGLVYNSPRPTEAYAVDFVVQQNQYMFYRKLNRTNVQDIHDRMAKEFLQKCPGAKKAFDMAFGAGTLMHAFRKLGIEVEGNEINDFSVQKLREQGFKVFQSTTRELEIDTKYDIVTMLDYLEHTYTPFDDLLKAHSMLKPGGMLYLKTLYLGSPPHIQKGELWQLFGIGHFYYFTPKVLLGMIRNAGFEIIDTRLDNLIHVSARKQARNF